MARAWIAAERSTSIDWVHMGTTRESTHYRLGSMGFPIKRSSPVPVSNKGLGMAEAVGVEKVSPSTAALLSPLLPTEDSILWNERVSLRERVGFDSEEPGDGVIVEGKVSAGG